MPAIFSGLSGLSSRALVLAATLPWLALCAAQTAHAEELPPGEPVATGMDAIVVTGTRRTDRILADSPVPVDVISGESLSRTGLSETNKILNQLVPSFNFPQPSIADGSDVIRPASLRGLGPDQTLVIINGKRRHVSALINVNGTVGRGSAAVDLNTIPTLAIERIEVLRDGASSQYGSDAIAGVINIRLKQASQGARFVASFGKYVTTLNDVASVTGLQTNAAGQPFLDPADPRYLAATTGADLKVRDGQYYTLAGNIGLTVGEGFVNVTAEYRDRDATNRSGFDTRPNYNQPTAAFDPRELTFNRRSFILGDAKTEDWNVFVNAGVPLGAFDVYAFGSYGERDGLSAANYRQANVVNNRDFSVLVPGTTPNAGNFVALRPDGFLPFIGSQLKDASGTLGIKGKLAGWNVDLSAGFGHNRLDYRTLNSLNASFGPQSQTDFDAGGLRFGQQLVNLDVERSFELGLASPLSVAFGAEYRNEDFKIRPGDMQSFAAGPFFMASQQTTAANCATLRGVFAAATGICSFPGRQAPVGAQGFPGFPTSAATDVSRHNVSVYAELDAEVLPGFTLTAAGRFEHYSDFGSTVSGKLAARYEPIRGLALRGSFSNGFRAPSLQQQFFTTTSTNFINGLPVDISTVSVSSPVARALGARDLKAEKSTNLSLGATLAPTSRFNLSVDYYHIKIRDRIVLTENLGAAGTGSQAVRDAVKAVLDANGFQSVGAARFFINGLDTTTEGVDVIASWRAPSSALGDWTLTAAYNHNDSAIDRRINTLGPLAQIPGIVLFGRVEGIRFTDGQPNEKLVLSAEGRKGPFGLTARSTRYGRVIAPGATAPLTDANSLTALGPDDARLRPKWITDLEARYTFMERFELAVGANNLFDVYPDRLPTGRRPDGGFYPVNQQYLPYSNFSPFGFNGRFLYARVSAGF
ncbi:TonB-dependent receptor plug domain-containing protein [Novosphingobium sp. JCM 18896]|uniref:TonB-dependent receptor plug domain-containing protein n=1 Tax=Novosphingobium sp. JCM 18896 TaxID=2989731 RepID=UPI0022224C8E|nr:TonB-dependent receptor [Novosphingobium sp. JCM 18896]MCW1427826.1 TonB-dependent receptor [Novosphingobium sp. JCM 18896]